MTLKGKTISAKPSCPSLWRLRATRSFEAFSLKVASDNLRRASHLAAGNISGMCDYTPGFSVEEQV